MFPNLRSLRLIFRDTTPNSTLPDLILSKEPSKDVPHLLSKLQLNFCSLDDFIDPEDEEFSKLFKAEEFPNFILHLPNLTDLYLHGWSLEKSPPDIQMLSNLKKLNVLHRAFLERCTQELSGLAELGSLSSELCREHHVSLTQPTTLSHSPEVTLMMLGLDVIR